METKEKILKSITRINDLEETVISKLCDNDDPVCVYWLINLRFDRRYLENYLFNILIYKKSDDEDDYAYDLFEKYIENYGILIPRDIKEIISETVEELEIDERKVTMRSEDYIKLKEVKAPSPMIDLGLKRLADSYSDLSDDLFLLHYVTKCK